MKVDGLSRKPTVGRALQRLRIQRLCRLSFQTRLARQHPSNTRVPLRASTRRGAAFMDLGSTHSASLKTTSEKLKVAVDVDEVLGQFVVALNSFCKERYGMEHSVEDYYVYHFATIWGCTQDESSKIVHEFFESPHFHQLPLVPGAFEALSELQQWCDLHVVTSRQNVIRDITIKWLSEHYPGIFTSVNFGNHFALEGVQKRKSELCKEIKAEVLIDDNPDYAMDCASSGMHVILYNWGRSYPWSRLGDKTRHSRIREVTCWSVVPSALKEFQMARRLSC
eukprot:g1437.t1